MRVRAGRAPIQRVPELRLLQLEVDVHGIGAARYERGGRRIDLRDALRGAENRLVHERVAARLEDLGARDLPVFFDPDPDRADKRFRLVENRGRLVPLAVEAVVDELVIPSELRGLAARACLRGVAGTQCGIARAMRVGPGLRRRGSGCSAGRCRAFGGTGRRALGRGFRGSGRIR